MYYMTYTHTLTSKAQVTIPKQVRDALGLRPGDRASFRIKANGEVVIERPKSLEEIHTMLGKPTFKDELSEREKLIGPHLIEKYVKKPR
jgi:AbrB family looped-hinge helix DNA binding protein